MDTKKLTARLIAIRMVQEIEHLLPKRSKDALAVARAFSKGEATVAQLEAALFQAQAAARAAGWQGDAEWAVVDTITANTKAVSNAVTRALAYAAGSTLTAKRLSRESSKIKMAQIIKSFVAA